MHSLDWGHMVDNELSLLVPQSRIRRSELVCAAQQIVGQSQLKPPISYNELQKLGEATLALIEGEPDELAFAMLMCSNELWRPYFE